VSAAATRRHGMRLAELGRIGDRFGRLIVEPELDRPLMRVASPVPARDPRDPAGGQQHVAPGHGQLVGDLGARLAAAYDQHGSGRQTGRAAVPSRIALVDVGRQPGGQSRDDRTALTAAGDHHGSGRDPSLGSDQFITAVAHLSRDDSDALSHREPAAESL
jgi:hypothetical protein